MNRLFQAFNHWILFRCYYYLPFLRPKGIVIKGKIKFDFKSFIQFTQDSKLNIEGKLSLKNARIYIKKSECSFKENADLQNAVFVIKDSVCNVGKHFKSTNVECMINHYSNFEIGDYVALNGGYQNKSEFYFYNATVKWGDNVNINAKINCHKSTFTIGDNVFINKGTEIRSEHSISIGSNNFISYDCILFDTNTHSLSHLSRRDEINNGFPNTTKQTDAIKNEIKKAPIAIGNDIWIGTRAIIFKGTVIHDRVIVGAASLLSGIEVPEDKKVVGNPGIIK